LLGKLSNTEPKEARIVNQATTFADLAADAQRQTLHALKQAQDLSLRGAELAVGLVPEAKPKDAVEGAFAFAGQLLQQQKAYALRMTEILTGAAEPAPAKTK
jgi:hypothetical protein